MIIQSLIFQRVVFIKEYLKTENEIVQIQFKVRFYRETDNSE